MSYEFNFALYNYYIYYKMEFIVCFGSDDEKKENKKE